MEDEFPGPGFADQLSDSIELLIDKARAGEKVISATKLTVLLVDTLQDLLELDNASMTPEIRVAVTCFGEGHAALLRAVEFLTVKTDVSIDQIGDES